MSEEPLIVIMIRNGGLRRAMKALGYITAWGIVRRDIGHDPSWSEYYGWWKQSESTTAREVRAFTRCLPGVKVSAVWERFEAQQPKRSKPVADKQEELVGRLSAMTWRT